MRLCCTEYVRRAIFYAQEECDRLHHPAVDAEHLLLGMLTFPSSLAGLLDRMPDIDTTPSSTLEDLLRGIGVSTSTLLETLNASLPAGDHRRNMNTDLELTPRGRQALNDAFAAAREFHHLAVGTPHLLIGLLQDTEGLAGRTLAASGVEPEAVRAVVPDLSHIDGVRALFGPPIGLFEARDQNNSGNGGTHMWRRFTQKARAAVFVSVDEAQQLGTSYVDTEHILLGITRDKESVACRILAELGVSQEALREALTHELSFEGGSDITDMQLTPRAKRVMDLAYENARALNNKCIGTEHLLLGLLDEGSGLASRILSQLGVDGERVRVIVRKWLAELPDRPATD